MNKAMMQNKKKQVFFNYADTPFRIKEATLTKQFIEMLFKQENKKLNNIRYVFCTDEYLLSINQQYLNHDYYTDIITFDLSDQADSMDSEIIGEVYVSVDRIRDNAKTQQCSFKEELHRVLFHGALHLCGYLDKFDDDAIIMRSKESFYLDEFGVSRNTVSG